MNSLNYSNATLFVMFIRPSTTDDSLSGLSCRLLNEWTWKTCVHFDVEHDKIKKNEENYFRESESFWTLKIPLGISDLNITCKSRKDLRDIELILIIDLSFIWEDGKDILIRMVSNSKGKSYFNFCWWWKAQRKTFITKSHCNIRLRMGWEFWMRKWWNIRKSEMS